MRNKITNYLIGLIIVIFAGGLQAQEKGRLGITVDAQYLPQIGIAYNISEKFQARLSTYLYLEFGDIYSENFSSLCLLFRFPSDETIRPYIGPDVTYDGFDYDLCLGAIAGIEYKLHPQLYLFAEIGPSVSIEYGSVSIINTGIGIKYYFKK